MSGYYRMDGTKYDDVLEWARDLEDGVSRTLGRDFLLGGYLVSTVWLGLDHNRDRRGPPLIFESMVFNMETGESNLDCRRYATKEEALVGHRALCLKWSEREEPES